MHTYAAGETTSPTHRLPAFLLDTSPPDCGVLQGARSRKRTAFPLNVGIRPSVRKGRVKFGASAWSAIGRGGSIGYQTLFPTSCIAKLFSLLDALNTGKICLSTMVLWCRQAMGARNLGDKKNSAAIIQLLGKRKRLAIAFRRLLRYGNLSNFNYNYKQQKMKKYLVTTEIGSVATRGNFS